MPVAESPDTVPPVVIVYAEPLTSSGLENTKDWAVVEASKVRITSPSGPVIWMASSAANGIEDVNRKLWVDVEEGLIAIPELPTPIRVPPLMLNVLS